MIKINETQYMDLSFSGIGNKLQGDKAEGKKLLIQLAQNYIDYKERIVEQEKMMQNLMAKQQATRAGIDNAIAHLKLKLPLAITLDKEIIVISGEDVTFESNVL